MAQTEVQSVARALDLLWMVRERPGVTLSELSRNSGLIPSTTLRLLSTLEGRQLIERDPRSKGYRLGRGTLALAAGLGVGQDLVDRLEPIVRELASIAGEQTALAVQDGETVAHVLTIDGAAKAGQEVILRPPRSYHFSNLHATALGKVFLAFAGEEQADWLIGRLSFEATGSRTITAPEVLRAHLVEVQRAGYATSIDENKDYIRGIAVPVWGASGRVVAGLSVHGPTIRFSRERISELAPVMLDFAERASERLGHAEKRRANL